MGVLELKEGYYLSGTKKAVLGIFEFNNLELKQKLVLKNISELN